MLFRDRSSTSLAVAAAIDAGRALGFRQSEIGSILPSAAPCLDVRVARVSPIQFARLRAEAVALIHYARGEQKMRVVIARIVRRSVLRQMHRAAVPFVQPMREIAGESPLLRTRQFSRQSDDDCARDLRVPALLGALGRVPQRHSVSRRPSDDCDPPHPGRFVRKILDQSGALIEEASATDVGAFAHRGMPGCTRHGCDSEMKNCHAPG